MNIAVILAGGTGSRMSLDKPKQFALINGRPLMAYTLSAFENSLLIDKIYFVSNKDYIDESALIIKEFNFVKVQQIIGGGKTRQESVYNALKNIEAKDDDIVVLHDCARPLVTSQIIEENIRACIECQAVETAIKVTDTIVECDGKEMIQPLDREKLYQVQTPQTFTFSLIKKAHQSALENNIQNASDDAQLIKLLGRSVRIVEGNKYNFKITTDEDLLIFNAILNKNRT